MKAKIKKINRDGIMRMETSGEVKEVIIKEEFLEPDDETIAVCFMGKDSSGIIEFKTEEFENIYNSIKKRIHLIKGFKKIFD
ncbi:hypothetical protein J4221_05730 [Candidatus Pacearchaeota archaeon]|nr:hypothetical protein [Candidatus Pacearchaeota archaeon]